MWITMDGEFTPIIAAGIEFSSSSINSSRASAALSSFKAAALQSRPPSVSPRKPPSTTPTKRLENNLSFQGDRKLSDRLLSPGRPPIRRAGSLPPPHPQIYANGSALPNGKTFSPWTAGEDGEDVGSGGADVSGDSAFAPKLVPDYKISLSGSPFRKVSVDVKRLRKLARQGSWRSLVERVKAAQKRGALGTPDEEMTYGTYHLFALMKLQNHRAAADELAAFGDLDSPQYRYENHSSLYPGKSGSMVPFALRCMHAELPHRTGKSAVTLDRLYRLLAHCNSQIDALQAALCLEAMPSMSLEVPTRNNLSNSNSSKDMHCNEVTDNKKELEEVGSSDCKQVEDEDFEEFVASAETVPRMLLLKWQQRKEAVCFSLVGHHVNQQQFIAALQLLNRLLTKSPSDPHLLTKVALVQLQMGDVRGAQKTFSDVEALALPTSDLSILNLVARNRGLLYVASGDLLKAIKEFDDVLARNPEDIVSANNKALCLLYSQQLFDATQILENSMYKGPRSMLNEAVVLNVCSMYELLSVNSGAAKKNLRTWLTSHGPDDFKTAPLRL